MSSQAITQVWALIGPIDILLMKLNLFFRLTLLKLSASTAKEKLQVKTTYLHLTN